VDLSKLNVVETQKPANLASSADAQQANQPLLSVRNLRVEFDLRGRPLEVVKGVSFDVQPGKVTALVGESGSGKSVISQCVMGILPKNGMISSGDILFNDPAKPGEMTNIAHLLPSSHEMRNIRGGRISIIFQEPMTSLSPVHTIGNQIEEACGCTPMSVPMQARSADRGHAGPGRLSRPQPRLSTCTPSNCPAACASAP
jgi:ABC-type glutathione transport system ATPase component